MFDVLVVCVKDQVFLDITFSMQSRNFIYASSDFWFSFPFEEGKNQFITSKFCNFSLVRFCLLVPLQQSQLLLLGPREEWQSARRGIKNVCRNAFCGFQVQKNNCSLLCSHTVSKAVYIFFFRNADYWGWVLLSCDGRAADSERSCIPLKLSIYLSYSMELKDLGIEDPGFSVYVHFHAKSLETSIQFSFGA